MRVGLWPGGDRSDAGRSVGDGSGGDRSGRDGSSGDRPDGGNPFARLFADGLRQAGAATVAIADPAQAAPGTIDVLHIHWPEQVFWAGGGMEAVARRLWGTLAAIARMRRAGVAVVWMVHNLRPHDMSRKRRLLWALYERRLCALTDGFMTLCPGTVETVRAGIPGLAGKPCAAIWHPAYPSAAVGMDPVQARRALGFAPGDRVFGFLGQLRPYKGVEDLIAAFAALPGAERRLLIAGGATDANYVARLRAACAADPRVTLRAAALTEAAFAAHQAACDLLVLPFRQSLHSGSAVHALSGHRPVLTPDSPFARALAAEVGEGWVRTFPRPLAPAHLADWCAPAGTPHLAALAPAVFGPRTLAFYRSLPAGPAQPGRSARASRAWGTAA